MSASGPASTAVQPHPLKRGRATHWPWLVHNSLAPQARHAFPPLPHCCALGIDTHTPLLQHPLQLDAPQVKGFGPGPPPVALPPAAAPPPVAAPPADEEPPDEPPPAADAPPAEPPAAAPPPAPPAEPPAPPPPAEPPAAAPPAEPPAAAPPAEPPAAAPPPTAEPPAEPPPAPAPPPPVPPEGTHTFCPLTAVQAKPVAQGTGLAGLQGVRQVPPAHRSPVLQTRSGAVPAVEHAPPSATASVDGLQTHAPPEGDDVVARQAWQVPGFDGLHCERHAPARHTRPD
jgi:hypothetical protein